MLLPGKSKILRILSELAAPSIAVKLLLRNVYKTVNLLRILATAFVLAKSYLVAMRPAASRGG